MKKFILLSMLFFACSFQMNAQQWAGSGSTFGNINRTGNVGLGTTTPSQKLDVNGNIALIDASGQTRGNIFLGGKTGSGENGLRLFGGNVNGGTSAAAYIDVKTSSSTDGLRFRVNTWDGGTERMRIRADGKVAINTTYVPSDYILGVKGKVICEEVKVQLYNNWPDYVFEADYDLTPLAEVEAHIQSKGYLHNTLSATEIEAAKGFEVGEMTKSQQEKIEEIFLHLIDMNKEIKELQQENVALKEQLINSQK